jgi:hypothetical protein
VGKGSGVGRRAGGRGPFRRRRRVLDLQFELDEEEVEVEEMVQQCSLPMLLVWNALKAFMEPVLNRYGITLHIEMTVE